MLISDHDFFAVAASENSFARGVSKLTGIVIRNAQLRRLPEDRLGDRVFGTRLSDRRGFEQESGGNIWGRVYIQKFGSSAYQSAGLVEQNCVDWDFLGSCRELTADFLVCKTEVQRVSSQLPAYSDFLAGCQWRGRYWEGQVFA
jgi:hypothetical protein